MGSTKASKKGKRKKSGRILAKRRQAEKKNRESEKARKRLEEVLSSNFLQRIVDNVQDFIVVKDRDLKYVLVNKAMLKYLGKSIDEVLGRTSYDLLPKEEADPRHKRDLEVLEKGTTTIAEYPLTGKGGVAHIFNSIKIPLKDEEGNVTHSVTIARDITERKKIEEELLFKTMFLDAQFETSIDGIIVVNREGEITLSNKLFGEMWDIPQEILDTRSEEKTLQSVSGQLKNPEKFLEKIKHLREHSKEKSRDEIEFKDGKLFATYSSPLVDSSGKHHGRIWFFRDITHIKRAEEALRESEEKYRVLVENSPNLVAINQDGYWKYVNKAMCERLGGTYEELTSPSFNFIEKVVPQRFRVQVKEAIARRLRGEPVSQYEVSLNPRDGTEIPVIVRGEMILYQGKPANEVIFIDISERKKMEEELKESEEKYRELFEEAIDAIFVADAETGILIDCNRVALELVGREKSELIGKHQQILHPPQRIGGEFTDSFKQHLREDGRVLETQVITKNGEIKEVAIKANRIELRGKQLLQGIFRDVTERRRMEEALQKSEKQYRTLYLNVPVGLYRTTPGPEGRFLTANPALIAMYGYDSEEKFLQLKASDVYEHPEDRTAFIERLSREGIVSRVELRLKRRDGSPIWGAVTAKTTRDEQGNILYFDGMVEDITERKRMEEELRRYSEHLEELVKERTGKLFESEEKLGTIYDSSIDGIHLVGVEDKRFFDGNKAFCGMLGVSLEELKNTRVMDIHPEESLPHVMEQFEKITRQEIEVAKDIPVKRRDGSIFYVDVSAAPTTLGGKQYLAGIFRDVTERRRMEEKLREAERLAAIGETAAMVGHDLHNPLQVLVNTVYLAKETLRSIPSSLPEKQSLEDLGRTINDQVEYMNKIVSDLQDYAMPMKPKLAPTSLPQLINDALSSVTVPESVKVSVAVEEGFPKLMVDSTLMRRMFTNLITNALNAMPDGGQLTISTSKTEEDAVIRIQDTGVGIPEENLDKLFKPLFTTRSKGQGFGLAVCKHLVETHDGSITVESQVDRGTTLTVKIPLQLHARN